MYVTASSGVLAAGVAWLNAESELDGSKDPALVADWTLEGVMEGQTVGTQVASAGDVDHDDHADALVSAHHDGEMGINAGAAFFFRGPLSGTEDTADCDASFHGGQAEMSVGVSMVPPLDLTGDGRSDVVLGAPRFDGYRGAILIVPGF